MKVRVQFHGILSDWMEVPQAEIHLPEGGTFADLLSVIRGIYGAQMPSQLREKDPEAFNRALWAMRGEEKLKELTAKLNDGEEIQFFLSLAGG